MDLGFMEPIFAWTNMNKNNCAIMERLDRFLSRL